MIHDDSSSYPTLHNDQLPHGDARALVREFLADSVRWFATRAEAAPALSWSFSTIAPWTVGSVEPVRYSAAFAAALAPLALPAGVADAVREKAEEAVADLWARPLALDFAEGWTIEQVIELRTELEELLVVGQQAYREVQELQGVEPAPLQMRSPVVVAPTLRHALRGAAEVAGFAGMPKTGWHPGPSAEPQRSAVDHLLKSLRDAREGISTAGFGRGDNRPYEVQGTSVQPPPGTPRGEGPGRPGGLSR